MTAPDQTNAEVSDERLREIANSQWHNFQLVEGLPLDFNAVRAIATELLNRRSVTSQASEGEAEPFNTGVGWENLSCDDQFALARKIASNVGYVLVAEPLISETEDRAEAMMLREALLDADEHLTGIENYGGEPAVRARRGRASIEAALASASPSKRVERLEAALKRQCDNMVFIVNHATLGMWHDKFKTEVEEDQLALGDRS